LIWRLHSCERLLNLQALVELNVSAIDRLCQKRLRSIRGSFPAEALGSAAMGLLYSDAAFANAVMGTKGGTLD